MFWYSVSSQSPAASCKHLEQMTDSSTPAVVSSGSFDNNNNKHQIMTTNLAVCPPDLVLASSFLRLFLSSGTSWSCIFFSGWSQDKGFPRVAARVWPYGFELCALYHRICCTLTTPTTQRPCSQQLDGGTEGRKRSEEERGQMRRRSTGYDRTRKTVEKPLKNAYFCYRLINLMFITRISLCSAMCSI